MHAVRWIFLGALYSVSYSLKLEDPNQPGVDFTLLDTYQAQITVDEDNGGALVKLATIVGDTIDLTINYSSTAEILQPLIAKSNENQALIINRLDYEALRAQSIDPSFVIKLAKTVTDYVSITVIIKNIDDESPTLTATTPCAMNEELAVDVQFSNCTFRVTDPDGFLNSMDYTTVDGTNGSIFTLKYKEPPSDDIYESDVYLVLKPGVYLDYETQTFYTIDIKAKDDAGHSTTPESVPLVVRVNDIADQPPVWLNLENPIVIDEETPTTIQIKAVDGDFGIDNDISYKIVYTLLEDFLHLDAQTGILTIDAIDRDPTFNPLTFDIKATEIQDFMQISSTVTITLIVNDLDDSIPEITIAGTDEKELNMFVVEGSTELNCTIFVTDLDEDENALYTAFLTTSQNPDFLTAFEVILGQVHKNSSLQLAITAPEKLDFDNPEWQTITMELHTVGTRTPTNTDVLPITISLTDINDEVPVFDRDEYIVTIKEDVPLGTIIVFIQAIDRDAEDASLKHEIVGPFVDYLQIDEFGGNVIVTNSDALDYEQRSQIYFTIRATDKVNHTATTRLTILIEDVNDENPKLVAPQVITVDEGVNDYRFFENIKAYDADMTANLEFSIDWDKSYAYKGTELITDFYIQCIDVQIVSNNSNKEVEADLFVNPKNSSYKFDYELYDTLYLYLTVLDTNTETNQGSDSTLIVIKLQNVNDNAPIFEGGLVGEVTENAKYGTFITELIASDADFDKIRYKIVNGTASTYWVLIYDSTSGIITTQDTKIDCDDPVRYQLLYDVTASDGTYVTTTTIKIHVIDENDNVPKLTVPVISIPEDTPNSEAVFSLEPTDGDRDEPYNTVVCTLGNGTSSEVLDRFKIESNTIYVSLTNGATLNKEDIPEFTFEIDCFDNPGGDPSNHIYRDVTVALTGANDESTTTENANK